MNLSKRNNGNRYEFFWAILWKNSIKNEVNAWASCPQNEISSELVNFWTKLHM